MSQPSFSTLIGFLMLVGTSGSPVLGQVFAQKPMPKETKMLSQEDLLKESARRPNAIRVVNKPDSEAQTKTVATYYWPVGHKIKIAFMGGDANSLQLIKDTASKWLEFVNLHFHYIDELEESEVRIRVITDREDASYTYLGTTCLTIPKSEHTMQLSLVTNRAINEKRGVILHEFGHMLGLPAENQNPNSLSRIDWQTFYAFAREHWGYDQNSVDANYKPSPLASFLYAGKPFDPNSVMMHPIPPEVLIGGNQSPPGLPTVLSKGDQDFVSKIYPKDSATLKELQTAFSKLKDRDVLATSIASAVKLDKFNQEAALADSMTSPRTRNPKDTQKALAERAKNSDDVLLKIIRAFSALSDVRRTELASDLGKAYLKAREESKHYQREKAIYGLDDQYRPETYKTIYDQSMSVGYLSNGIDRLGTCFMVGTDLVLTCDHCILRPNTMREYFDAGNLNVRFGLGAQPELEEDYKVKKIVFQGDAGTVDGVATVSIDFALLSLKPGTKGGKLPSADNIKPLPISSDRRPARDTALYVIGYPGRGNKTVADNSHIFAPFANSDETKVSFELEVYGEAAQLRERSLVKQDPMQDPNEHLLQVQEAEAIAADMTKRFKASFKRGTGSPVSWYLISEFVTIPAHPAFALDSDTYHGNSGSPVISRRSSEVVGVLFRGEDDHYVGPKAGWLHHEEAIPIHVIMQNWKDKAPAQLAQYNVSF